ncbi:MAG: RDD family protein [Verrucomicrobia bacterium]|nr:RDD family protein [Verrucomicrobiota bacterium]
MNPTNDNSMPHPTSMIRRWFATFIDLAFCAGIVCCYFMIFAYGVKRETGSYQEGGQLFPDNESLYWVWFGGPFVFLFWIYHSCAEASVWQATIGKLITGLKVTDLQGNRISYFHATGRYLAKLAIGVLGIPYYLLIILGIGSFLPDIIYPLFVLFAVIIYVSLLVAPLSKRKCPFQDFFSRTVVTKK